MRRGQGLSNGDKVEKRPQERRRHRDMTPAGAVIERGGQYREGGNAVENHRKSEPEQGHTFSFARRVCAKIQYICIAPSICDHAHRPEIATASVRSQPIYLERKPADCCPTK